MPRMISRMIKVLRSRSVLAAPTRVLRTRSGTVAPASGVGISATEAPITGVAVG